MGLVQPCAGAKCPALRAEAAKIERYEIDAQASKAVYDPMPGRKAPDGYHNATDDELADMNLSRDYIDNPIDPKTGKPSNFRSAVFINDKTGETLIAYKGTTPSSLEDWKNNAQQGMGKDSFYYTRAQQIATRAAQSPAGDNMRFTGHSLGGGLASAAATVTGKDATTFNAAGLHPDTVKNVIPGSKIDSVHVRGEVLTSVQQLGLPKAASTTDYPLDPPPGFGKWLVASGALFGIKGIAAASAVRSGMLHTMGSVDTSLANRKAQVAADIKKNGC